MMFGFNEESTVVWGQLLRLAEEGDLRAIKLYYEMLEKKQRQKKASAADTELEQMAAIRRAVFGERVSEAEEAEVDDGWDGEAGD
ncbi:MAG: hypothetical protein E7604_01605 [Ruminococcaceae bacterium]|nr:hypothetical protein [Oscillospiraceae bacterium]